jgi:hypothetical protein
MTKLNNKLSILLDDRTRTSYYESLISKDWLIGFIEAEGCFYGKGRNTIFSVAQHLSDWHLLVALQTFLGGGKLVPRFEKDGRLGVELVINNREEIREVLIPFISNNLRTPKKLIQFNNLIGKYFDLPPTLQCPKLTAEWVAGFVDGDGEIREN